MLQSAVHQDGRNELSTCPWQTGTFSGLASLLFNESHHHPSNTFQHDQPLIPSFGGVTVAVIDLRPFAKVWIWFPSKSMQGYTQHGGSWQDYATFQKEAQSAVVKSSHPRLLLPQARCFCRQHAHACVCFWFSFLWFSEEAWFVGFLALGALCEANPSIARNVATRNPEVRRIGSPS